MAGDDQDEMLPDGASELRILKSFAQESPVYPGTEARRNVTVRRSRDRLSGNSTGEARTPEAVASRRSSMRARDRRYSRDNDQNLASQSRTERQHPKIYEEDARGEYLLASRSPEELIRPFLPEETFGFTLATPSRMSYEGLSAQSGQRENEQHDQQTREFGESLCHLRLGTTCFTLWPAQLLPCKAKFHLHT